jgi:chromosomal replication initiation ATPase DnaA
MKAEEIAKRRGVRVKDMLGTTGSRPIFAARRELAVYLRSLGKSYPKIGELMGRDHTSIMSLVEGKYRVLKAERHRASVAARKALKLSPEPQAQPEHPERVFDL